MFDKAKMFSFVNAEEANKFIGSYGFFADSISDLKLNIKDNFYKKLVMVNTGDTYNIQTVFQSNDNNLYGLFYPLKYVSKEPTEVTRPFRDINELKKVTELDVGSIVTLREIYDRNHVFKALITSIDDEGIQISQDYYTIDRLHQCLEYHFKDNWFRFGVKEFI